MTTEEHLERLGRYADYRGWERVFGGERVTVREDDLKAALYLVRAQAETIGELLERVDELEADLWWLNC